MSRRALLFLWRSLAALALILASASPSFASTIRLLSSAVVGGESDGVRLAQIAALDGAAAEALADVVVVSGVELASTGAPWARIGVDEVRRALERGGANLGRVALSGSACVVRIEGRAPVEAERRKSEGRGRSQSASGEVVSAEGPVTVKSLVASACAGLFGVAREGIRFVFDEADQPLLSQTEWGRRIAVQPMTTAGSSRVMVGVRIYAGDRLVEDRRITADVEVRRRVVTTTRTVERRAAIPADALNEAEQWMKPGGPAPVASAERAIGSIARCRIEAGSVIRESELEPPVLVRRNELVNVHCLRGGFEIRTRARAKQDGAYGDVIEFTLEGSKRPFTARIDGPGLAVADLDRVMTRTESAEGGRRR